MIKKSNIKFKEFNKTFNKDFNKENNKKSVNDDLNNKNESLIKYIKATHYIFK